MYTPKSPLSRRLVVRLARAGIVHGDFNEFNLLVDGDEKARRWIWWHPPMDFRWHAPRKFSWHAPRANGVQHEVCLTFSGN